MLDQSAGRPQSALVALVFWASVLLCRSNSWVK